MPLVELDPNAQLDPAPAPPAAAGKLVTLDPNEPLDAAPVTTATTVPPIDRGVLGIPKVTPADRPLDARLAGSVGTGANDLLETVLGAPVDLLAGAINRAPSLAHYLSGGAIPEPAQPLIINPVGGSQSLRGLIAGTVGRTEPSTPTERALYGAGGAAMTVPLMATGLPALAEASEATELAPALADALSPATAPALARAGTIAAGSGGGGGAARETVGKVTDNPWALAGADIAGSLAGTLATGGALAVPRIGAQIARPMTAGGQQTIAGRVLNTAAGTPEGGLGVTGMAASPQPAGITPTLGDVTGNRGLQAVQRAVEAATPEAGAAAQNVATQNNQRILDSFDQIGQPGERTPQQISQAAAQRLETIRADQQARASGAFRAVDPGQEAMVPTGPLQDRYDDYVTGLTAARRRFLPDSYSKLLEGYEPQEPLQELQDFSSTLKTDARQAGSGASPDYNKANVLSGLHDALFPEGGPEGLLTPAQGDVGDALSAARDQWRNYAQTYTQPAAIKSVLRADGTPDSAALDKLLGSGQGQSERVGQFLNAAQGDPELLQHGRDWFAAKMMATGGTAAQDQEGSQFLNGNQLRKFADANQPLIDSGLFDDTHRQAIGEAVDAANLVQRTARAGTPGGSDTYRNLATGNYLRGMGMSPLAAAIAGAPEVSGGAVGAGLGAHLGGPVGAMVGTPLGATVGHMLSFQRPRANVLDLIGQATRDPTLAGQLMTRAAARPPTPRGFSLQDVLAAGAGAAFGQ